MTPEARTALLHRLEIARRSAASLQPWARVAIQREVLIDLIDLVAEMGDDRPN